MLVQGIYHGVVLRQCCMLCHIVVQVISMLVSFVFVDCLCPGRLLTFAFFAFFICLWAKLCLFVCFVVVHCSCAGLLLLFVCFAFLFMYGPGVCLFA